MILSKSTTSIYVFYALLTISCLYTYDVSCIEPQVLSLNMPEVRPLHDEYYLCTSKRIDPDQEIYVVGFKPNASASKVHHILIHGCNIPGRLLKDTPQYVWECGEMNYEGSSEAKTPYDRGPICQSGSYQTILFGWALDAPSVELPPHVGFRIGGQRSQINYLVMQVHYGHTMNFQKNPELTDNSGIDLEIVSGPNTGISKIAGIYLLLSYGYVNQGISKHVMQCQLNEDIVIHPFRFRTHTHKLGVKVGAYKIPADEHGKHQLIGEHNPQEPQMFYPVADPNMTLELGDSIYAYCDYNNTQGKTVYIGATAKDEMCNFYMMYWTESKDLIRDSDCLKHNPPSWF